ncbi:MAG: TonB-dependent receptor [Gemmatimonadota bacterium]|nr:TonB-dependent receptor [Gemmatimonadota bacterium]
MLAAIAFVAVAGTAAAQAGRISGKVTDGGGNAIGAATVQAYEGLRTVGVASTSDDGTYRLALKPGTYGVKITRIGFKPFTRSGIAVANAAVTLNVTLDEMPTQLNTVAITGIAEEEKVNKAPAAISVLSQQTINETVTATQTEQLRSVPGIDITSGGVVQSNVVARGFNNIFSGSLLTLTDNRFNFVPSLRVNVSYMSPTSNEDIERMEVVLGPAAALYGPNATQGVLHVITKSPFNSKGGSLTMDIGEQSLLRMSGRYAGTVGSKFGYKVSADRLTATDFESFDAVEAAAGRQRSFDIERTAADFRFDWRPDAKTEVVANYGRTLIGSSVEPTGLGAAQIKGWSFNAYQLRAKRGRLFAQVFMNASDAGDTYLLRTGQTMVDQSNQKVAQMQHSIAFGAGRQTFVYGADYLSTEPKTGGTINGRNESDDNFTEVGGYVHSITHLNKYWDAVAAIRYDKHSRLSEGNWSPRAALVYNPSETQSFRVSYNKGFSNPSSNNQFLDLAAGYIGGTNSTNSLFTVRALGTPASGLQFRRDCATGVGGLCMKSPFNPGGKSAFVPASAASFYKAAVAAAAAGGLGNSVSAGLAAAGVPAALVPTVAGAVMQTLAALQPTSAQVGTKLRVLNPTTARFSDVAAGDVRDIEQIRPTLTTGWEAGWKGQIGKSFYGTVDWWYSERSDFVGPLIVETPNVFLDAGTLAGFLNTNLAAALTPVLGPATAGALAAGLSPSIAAGLGGVSGSATTGVPLGVVNPDYALSNSTDIILAYRNFGKVKVSGLDFSGTYMLDEYWSLYSTYSWVNKDYFSRAQVGGVSDIALNAPRDKGTFAVRFRDDAKGMSAETRFRRTASFPGNSGVYVGQVAGYNLLDASFTFRPGFLGGAMWSVNASNLLNLKHSEFIGGAALGRLVMTRIQYQF